MLFLSELLVLGTPDRSGGVLMKGKKRGLALEDKLVESLYELLYLSRPGGG